ncbi:hypothetical protein OSB04_005061 [Centaurea solstitialis]|uniref:BHLH domain-containing protein n=1 Tax=Centaurea solstitialis TaxID=347529 RepID=A0AA38TQV6_9ASTR|nr:hypothetical protein OSB04_005061 [Centaurea solstitialis]
MQPTGGGGGGGGGSGGLARFQSAPATWLEQLLESDEDVIIDPPKPPLLPHHHSVANPSSAIDATGFVDPSSGAGGGSGGFLRQNSSPADFLSQIHGSEGHFSSYGIPPVKASYDDYRISTRDVGLEESQVKFTTQMSGDQSALLDVEMDKILADSVPCRVRAKRGFATHPRSIAERVRRTRISDRIRKLQELVPNMDKVYRFSLVFSVEIVYV